MVKSTIVYKCCSTCTCANKIAKPQVFDAAVGVTGANPATVINVNRDPPIPGPRRSTRNKTPAPPPLQIDFYAGNPKRMVGLPKFAKTLVDEACRTDDRLKGKEAADGVGRGEAYKDLTRQIKERMLAENSQWYIGDETVKRYIKYKGVKQRRNDNQKN